MPNLIYATDITNRLTRLNAELTRRNGYPNLSTNVPVTAAGGNPTSNTLAVATDINSIFSGLRLINSSGVPADRSAITSQMLEVDLTAIDGNLTSFEATPRYGGANDCAAACAGMCVDQCTTGCTGCTGTCTDVCTGCTGSCTSCSGCTGTCTSCSGCTSCTGCWGNCTGGCYTGCTGCKGTCSNNCAKFCAANCSGKAGGS